MAFVASYLAAPKQLQSRRDTTCSQSMLATTFIPTQRVVRFSSWPCALPSKSAMPLIVQSPALWAMQIPSPPKILISGAPASGKGTQCELIVQKYNVVHISTGDMLRAAVKAQTTLGLAAKSYMDSGKLVPDDLVISMLNERITQQDCQERGWLLDGFPRTAVQATALDDAGIIPTSVLLLSVDDEILVDRVVGRRSDPVTGKIYHIDFSPATDPEVVARLVQRSDDTREKALVRLQTYATHAESIQQHYNASLRQIDGNREKSKVFDDICTIIEASLDQDNNDDGGNGSSFGAPSSPPQSPELQSSSESVKSMPVSDFVRRAEEAYEKGVLLEQDVNWSGQASADSLEASSSSSYSDIIRRLDLALGDLVALLSFVYVGRAFHGEWSLDFGVVKTAAPFVAAWLLTSPLLGAYTRGATANIPEALKSFAKAWAVAVPMGIGFRGKYAHSMRELEEGSAHCT